MNRREFIRSAIATVTIMVVGVSGLYELAEKAAANQSSLQEAQLLPPVSSTLSQTGQASQVTSGATSSQPSQSSSSAPAGYVFVAQASSLAGKSSAYFTHPVYGDSLLLSMNGQWRAFSATCTHRPCTVEYVSSEIYCPCHGSTFSATNGSVTRGPAQVALEEYGVVEQDGGVYVTSSVIN